MSKPKALIFDFDGTLADTLPLYLSALKQTSPLSRHQRQKAQQLPLQKVFAYVGASPWAKLRVLFFHVLRMRKRIEKATMWEQLRQAVVTLHQEGHQLFIVSANYKRNVRAFLRSNHLTQYFEQIQHVSVRKKAKALREFVFQLQLDGSSTFYVGNEPADIKAAHTAGIQSIGVLWSGQDSRALRAQNPTTIIARPQDLLRLL